MDASGLLAMQRFFDRDMNDVLSNIISRYLPTYGSHPSGSNIVHGGLLECDLQELGVATRNADSKFGQSECATGIQIPVGGESPPCTSTSAADGNCMKISSFESDHSKMEPVAVHPNTLDKMKPETILSTEQKEKSSIMQNFMKSKNASLDDPLLAVAKPEAKMRRESRKKFSLQLNWSKRFSTAFALVVIGIFHICGADGTGDAYLGSFFPSFIILNCPIPESGPAIWLRGRITVQKHAVNRNLKISYQNISNFDCETKIRAGNLNLSSPTTHLYQFPMQVFNSCALEINKDLHDFIEGKKFAEVSLKWEENVLKEYRFQIQNQTLQIYYVNGSDLFLQLDDVQCSITFKERDNTTGGAENETTTVENSSEKKPSDIVLTTVATVIGVIAAVTVLLLLSVCIIKRHKSNLAQKLASSAAQQESLL